MKADVAMFWLVFSIMRQWYAVKAMPKEISVMGIVEVGHSYQTIKLLYCLMKFERCTVQVSLFLPFLFNRATGLCA